MQFGNKTDTAGNHAQPRALVIDEEKDRYRRKERTTMLKDAGYKVFPVLRMPDARGRCKPGSFQLIVVNPGENAGPAIELCEEIKKCNPDQKLFLVMSGDAGNRDYAVSNWDELKKRLEPAKSEEKRDLVAA